MKKLYSSVTAFFAFTAMLCAQQTQEKQDQLPPTVTEQQVERDAQAAKLAKQQRVLEKEKAKTEYPDKQKNEEDKRITNGSNNTLTKKASTKPGKQ